MSVGALDDLIHFALPDELAAHEPPEARGLERDEVRLLVSEPDTDVIHHARFTHLAEFLERGDVLVVNTSATINASLPAIRAERRDREVRLHLSTQLSPTQWAVELRQIAVKGSAPLLDAAPGERLLLAGNGEAQLIDRWPSPDDASIGTRLWVAGLDLPNGVMEYTYRYGEPIRYSYVPRAWPLSYYQTMFSREPGSAEMPSAGRPLSPRVVAALTNRGVRIAAITLHTGVSSLETGERPYPERYRVPEATAIAVNETRRNGGRVIAVGTTVVRALESAALADGSVSRDAEWQWTNIVVSSERPPRIVDGIVTGLHAPRASHLAMLETFAGRERLIRAYDEALREQYLWHEFGDSHLIAPRRTD
jgi:S-adenosylmethionine:tRNA ribosyltransferase-isomerase